MWRIEASCGGAGDSWERTSEYNFQHVSNQRSRGHIRMAAVITGAQFSDAWGYKQNDKSR